MQSFTFYDDYYRVAQKIKSKKAKQEIIYAIVAYAFEGVEPALQMKRLKLLLQECIAR